MSQAQKKVISQNFLCSPCAINSRCEAIFGSMQGQSGLYKTQVRFYSTAYGEAIVQKFLARNTLEGEH